MTKKNANQDPATNVTAPEDDGTDWDTVSDDADETCRLAPQDKANGLDLRFQVAGEFRGTKVVPGKFGLSELHILRIQNGEQDYNLGVWGFKQMSRAMKQVPVGQKVRLTYDGERDIDKGNPMKCAKVEMPKGAPRNRFDDDNIPF